MPIVAIQVTHEGMRPGTASLNAHEKAVPIEKASQLLLGVVGRPLDSSFVGAEESRTRIVDGAALPWATASDPDWVIRAANAERRIT